MKLSIFTQTLVGILISSSAYAGYTDIPQDQLGAYKKAFLIAGENSSLPNCSGYVSNRFLDTYITNATSGKVNQNGDQPILIFEKADKDNSKYIATVMSSRDYKIITSIKVEEFAIEDINVGDLLHPKLAKGYVLKSAAECH